MRILRVTGRNDDMMIIRGVNVYPSQVEAVLVGFPGISPHYQIILTREGALDAMTVEVELAPDFAGDRERKAGEVTAPYQVTDRRDLRSGAQIGRRGAALAGQGGAGPGST